MIGKENQVLARLNEVDEKLEQWEDKLKEKKQAVLDLENRLEASKLTYDFILLNEGFSSLYGQKAKESDRAKNTYTIFAATVIMTPIVLLVAYIVLYFIIGEKISDIVLYITLPATSFVLLLFYFIRVALQDKRSIQSQMMQLELRMALCQFIHNYAEESEKLHKKNQAGFEKFENIIFSPIVASDDNIPTTFDGVEQLAKIFEVFKK